SYFGLCPTETIAVGQTCLYSMARSTCHELTKRSTSSKGSSDTCISDGVSTFLYRAFTAHGPHLVGIHSRFSLSSLEAGFDADARFDDPRQLGQRGLLQPRRGGLRRGQVVGIPVAGVVIGGIPRGLRFPPVLVRERTTGHHQPLLG